VNIGWDSTLGLQAFTTSTEGRTNPTLTHNTMKEEVKVVMPITNQLSSLIDKPTTMIRNEPTDLATQTLMGPSH
jgi:hypothetical protein